MNNKKRKGEIEQYKEDGNRIDDYGELLSDIQDRDFDEKDVRKRFKLLTDLALTYSTAFMGEERKDIKTIRKIIRIVDGKSSIFLAEKDGYIDGSIGHGDLKKLLKKANDLLDNLFDIIYERILKMKMLFTRFSVFGNMKISLLKAVSDAGGKIDLSANTEEVQELMGSIDGMMKQTMEVLKDPEILEDKDIF